MSEEIPKSLAQDLSIEMAVPDQHGGGPSVPSSDLFQQSPLPAAEFELLAMPTTPEAMVPTEMPEIMLPKGVLIELQQFKEHE